MSILIVKPGMLTTIQDLGRTRFRAFGVNPNGPMDPISARLLNALLGNLDDAPFLEMHFPAPEIKFEGDAMIAIGGANFSPAINSDEIPNWRVRKVRTGDVLTFRRRVRDNRAYLAVANGFDVEKWLGSASTNLTAHVGGHFGRRLEAGDRIATLASGGISDPPAEACLGPSFAAGRETRSVRLIPGPEFAQLTALSESKLFTEPFKITKDSDRMGFRLAGPQLDRLIDREMLSSGTTFGTVQLLPNGQLIILMADHQTTGGYPRIANIAYVDLGILGQLGAGDEVQFQFIDRTEAELLRMEFERELAFLKMGVKLRAPISL